MAIFEQVVDFLPANTTLMVFVNPSGDLEPHLEKLLISHVELHAIRRGVYVPLQLLETQKISFSISNQGRLHRKLRSCECRTPALPEKDLKSINDAYQSISGIFEKSRASRGGKVYDSVYFKEDYAWEPLEVLRERIYKVYQEEFDRRLRIFNDRVGSYLQLHPESYQFLISRVEEKNGLVRELELQTQDLEAELRYLNNLFQQSKISVYRRKIDEFKQRLEGEYPETKGRNSWQEWIQKNNWLFGIQYGHPIGKLQISVRSIPDFLFPTPDGFVDVLEIKSPSLPVLMKSRSHAGAFRWSGEVNEAIGQVTNYLQEMESRSLEIAKWIREEYALELSIIKPRAFILIGRSEHWKSQKREFFRKLNHSLHGIEVLTYTDLLRRAENLIKLYTG